MSEELDASVIDFVQRVLHAMGLELDITVEEHPDNARLNIAGAGAEVLLRRQERPSTRCRSSSTRPSGATREAIGTM